MTFLFLAVLPGYSATADRIVLDNGATIQARKSKLGPWSVTIYQENGETVDIPLENIRKIELEQEPDPDRTSATDPLRGNARSGALSPVLTAILPFHSGSFQDGYPATGTALVLLKSISLYYLSRWAAAPDPAEITHWIDRPQLAVKNPQWIPYYLASDSLEPENPWVGSMLYPFLHGFTARPGRLLLYNEFYIKRNFVYSRVRKDQIIRRSTYIQRQKDALAFWGAAVLVDALISWSLPGAGSSIAIESGDGNAAQSFRVAFRIAL